MNLPSLVCKEIMYNKGSHFYALETIKSTLIPPPQMEMEVPKWQRLSTKGAFATPI